MEEKTWTKRFTSLISKNDKRRECQQETHQIHQVYQTGIRPTVPLVVGPVTAVRLPRTSLPKIWAENCNTCSPTMSYWHLNISCTLRTQVLVFPVNGLLFYVYVSCRFSLFLVCHSDGPHFELFAPQGHSVDRWALPSSRRSGKIMASAVWWQQLTATRKHGCKKSRNESI